MDVEGYEVEVIRGMNKTLRDPIFKKLFVEIHPHIVSKEKMKNFLNILEKNGFKLKFAVSRDNYQRKILNQARVEKISLEKLMKDRRVLNRELAFELFLER